MIQGDDMCEHCGADIEFEVEEGQMLYKCPECGKYMVLCSICPDEAYNCGSCKISKKCKELNEKEDIK